MVLIHVSVSTLDGKLNSEVENFWKTRKISVESDVGICMKIISTIDFTSKYEEGIISALYSWRYAVIYAGFFG